MHPIVSVIIPCYNSESTLEETLESLLVQSFYDWEAILVNDGSPDNLEETALKWVKTDKRFQYYKKKNGGLASARNYGIQKAKGRYILPLDSDNKIRPDFVMKSIDVFENDSTIGVVYGNAMKFGEINEEWIVGEFDELKMLNHNYIDACAVIKRLLFEEVGFYYEKLPFQGHEDWEFWLRVMKTKYNFYYLNEITFDYRVSSSSMINQFNQEMMISNFNFIRHRHNELYVKGYTKIYNQLNDVSKRKKISIVKKICLKIFSPVK